MTVDPDVDTAEHGIAVKVEPRWLPEHSSERERRFAFSYTVTITNEGSEPATLLARHWIITDAHGDVEEVRGPGVVGQQPVLPPGQSFKYTSFCQLNTSFGTMHGSYEMSADDGSSFEVEIAPFALGEEHVATAQRALRRGRGDALKLVVAELREQQCRRQECGVGHERAPH